MMMQLLYYNNEKFFALEDLDNYIMDQFFINNMKFGYLLLIWSAKKRSQKRLHDWLLIAIRQKNS
jgi:hypothetical protein